MNESHYSCRDLYDCSSEELEKLTSFAIENGALGSRLTGAGWGGCTISMVRNSDLENFLSKLGEYYSHLHTASADDTIYFATKPGRGACVFDPSFVIWMG